MRVYKNSLGITCIEPADGYLLSKNGQTFKKACLGKNDRAELYTEIKDENVKHEIQDTTFDISDNMILISPNGKRFKLVVNNDGSLSTREI